MYNQTQPAPPRYNGEPWYCRLGSHDSGVLVSYSVYVTIIRIPEEFSSRVLTNQSGLGGVSIMTSRSRFGFGLSASDFTIAIFVVAITHRPFCPVGGPPTIQAPGSFVTFHES